MNNKNNYIRLSKSFLVVIIFLFVIIVYRIGYVAMSPKVDGIDLREFAAQITWTSRPIRAQRGTIFDANGDALARNARGYTVIAFLTEERGYDRLGRPRFVVDRRETAQALSEILNTSEEWIYQRLGLTGYQVEFGPGGRNLSELTRRRIEALELPGIGFIQGVRREYPFGDFASYILGYARPNDEGEITGGMGIEARFNTYLQGTDGRRRFQSDPHGFRIAGTREYIEEAEDGYDIHLTIDSNIQIYLENAAAQIGENAEWVTITVADARTGAILGSAATPSFNPNALTPDMNYRNPLTSFSFEPGSTHKIFSYMAAMEHGLYRGDELFNSGHIMVDGFRIRDWNNVGWGQIDFDKGFAYSSNVAAVMLAQRLGVTRLMEFYDSLGFGTPTGIQLPNEYAGRSHFRWNTELASASFGQGVTTTPIQNIQALTVFGNDGMMLQPFIVDRVVNPQTGEVVFQAERTEIRQVASSETIEHLMHLMDISVNTDDRIATGFRFQTPNVRLVGKTGTAQFILPNGQYSQGTYENIRAFSGVFPKEDPQYIIYIATKRFRGTALGPYVAAIVESIARYKNIEDRPSDVDETKIVALENYVNRSLESVTEILEAEGLVPVIIGNGDVIINQFPRRNVSVVTGTKVFLKTNSHEITMPNAIGWSRSEIITFANMANLPYTINGHGRVRSLSINQGEIIDGQNLIITLDNRGGIVEREEENEEDDES